MRVPTSVRRLLLASIIIAGISSGHAATYVSENFNPVDVYIADPQVLKDGDTYYVYGTTGFADGFEAYSSTDLIHWEHEGYVWHKSTGGAGGTTAWGDNYFWAPEVIKRGSTYYVYYTATPLADNRLRVCVASSSSPVGPFHDLAAPLLQDSVNIFDPSPYYDPASGNYYLYYTRDTTQSPISYNYSELRVLQLGSDMKSFSGSSTLCLTGNAAWEYNSNNHYFIEGPAVMKEGSCIYTGASGNAWNTVNYGLGYATATSPTGPWTKRTTSAAFLKSTSDVFGPGHGGFTKSPDGSENILVYHRRLTSTQSGRELGIDRILFDPNFTPPKLDVFVAPTHLAQVPPAGATPKKYGGTDEFTSALDMTKWSIVGKSANWSVSSGKLNITGDTGSFQGSSSSERNLFLQYMPEGDFTIDTQVTSSLADGDQGELWVWQDQSNFLLIRTAYTTAYGLGRIVQAYGEIDGTQNVAQTLATTANYLRIVRSGNNYTLSYSANGTNWTQLGSTVTAGFHNQLRVGLNARSSTGATISFERFGLDQGLGGRVAEGIDDQFASSPLNRNLWLVHNEVPSNHSITSGKLRIVTQDGDLYQTRNDAHNLVLQPAPDDTDLVIETRVTFDGTANYEQAFITFFRDHNNYVKLSTVYAGGDKIEAATEEGGVYYASQVTNTWGNTIDLRIVRDVDQYSFYVKSSSGSTWTQVGSPLVCEMDPAPLFIGVGAFSPVSKAARNADFEYFGVTKP